MNMSSLVQIMAWHRLGYNPLFGPMMTITKPQQIQVETNCFEASNFFLQISQNA